MATSMEALLKLRADVVGGNKIVALNRGLQGLENSAKGVTGAMRGLTGASAGLSGALGALAPLLSVAGLAGMVKNTIAAGDAMYDLSQRTGVSVEALARFKKAAAVSGTDIEGVSKGLVKLNKAMVEAATGSKQAAGTFDALSINVKNADGSLKSADQVMLEVANRFKAMPDGAAKTALALRLFGKSGAELVPLLNMGGNAIEQMSVKMTTAFAKKADEYSDKLAVLGGKIGALGADLTIALLPALQSVTETLTQAVTAFNGLPDPIKNAAVASAALALAWGPLTGLLKGAGGLLATAANGMEILRYQTALAGGVMPLLAGGLDALKVSILAIPGWGWVLAGVTALGLLGKALYDNNAGFRSWVNNVGSVIASDFANSMKTAKELGANAARAIGGAWQGLVRITSSAATAIGNAFAGPFGFIGNAARQAFGVVQQAIASLWNALPEPIRKALGQAGKMAANLAAMSPAGYLIGVGVRAAQMGPQKGVSGAGGGGVGGSTFTPDLNALQSGGGGSKAKAAADKAKQMRDAIATSAEALAKARAELGILRELDPVKKIQLEYAEKRRAVEAAATSELSKALSVEEQANIQRTRAVEIQKLNIEETNALKDKYKELGDAAYDAALKAQTWGSAAEASNTAMAGFRDGISSYLESIGTLGEGISNLTQNALKGMEDAIVSLTTTGTFNFRQFALSIVEETTRMVTRLLIIAPILQAIQSLLPGGGIGANFPTGAKALSTGKIFPGGIFANGGIMTGDGPLPLRKYAGGGIASSPQLAMFGEGSMNEAYVPLPDGRRIPVAMQGGGSSPTINVSVDAKGTSVQGDAGKGEQLARVVAQAVQAELIKQKRPGGLIAA